MKNARLIRYLEKAHNGRMVLASVCTGSFILAAAGLLDGKAATTHHNALAELRAYPQIKVLRRRIVDEGLAGKVRRKRNPCARRTMNGGGLQFCP